ncbi:MAG: hypothetical protein HY342_06515 [Candidatus Lambdaproteobacteria bacterium]|nr:hypothetical protein [Candidatus Lambdaproteobacteria bacterium]
MQKTIIAIVVVFVVWGVLDYVLHGLILTSSYASSSQLWRPMEEMNMVLIYIVTLVAAACFVYIYTALITDRSQKTALSYGLVFGLGAGISMGYGSYAVMPIPYVMALAWFLWSILECLVGAWIAWAIVKRGAA